MKKYLRAFQVRFPLLQDTRFWVTSSLMKLTKSPHEQDFYALAQFKPEPDQVLVDVGANRGMTIISMMLFNNLKKNEIIGFEPNFLIFDKLKNNPLIHKNQQVSLYMCALSDHNAQCPLYIPFYGKWIFDGLASLNYAEAKDWLDKDRLWRFDKRKVRVEAVNCELKRLDDFNLNPYFIKIDVQGHELQVLKGAENTIRKYHPIFLIECVNEKIMQFLEPFGYGFFYYNRGRLIRGNGRLNTFCMTDERFAELNFKPDI